MRCSTSACRRRNSTGPSAGSRIARTARSTCGWTPTRPGRPTTSSTGTRRTNSPASSVSTATNGSRIASPQRSSPLARSTRRPGSPRWSPRAIPAPARRTGRSPGQAHVPGDPDRGQRRARRVAGRARPRDRRARARRPTRRAVVPLGRGPDRQGPHPHAETGGCECPPELPCVCGAVQTVRLVRKVPKRPSAAEQAENRRASSARLRVAEKLEPTDLEPTDGSPVMASPRAHDRSVPPHPARDAARPN